MCRDKGYELGIRDQGKGIRDNEEFDSEDQVLFYDRNSVG